MSYYAINAIRLDSSNRITHVLWAKMDTPDARDFYPHEAPVDEVANAMISGGDQVLLLIEESPEKHTITGAVKHKVYENGNEGIEIEGIDLDLIPKF